MIKSELKKVEETKHESYEDFFKCPFCEAWMSSWELMSKECTKCGIKYEIYLKEVRPE